MDRNSHETHTHGCCDFCTAASGAQAVRAIAASLEPVRRRLLPPSTTQVVSVRARSCECVCAHIRRSERGTAASMSLVSPTVHPVNDDPIASPSPSSPSLPPTTTTTTTTTTARNYASEADNDDDDDESSHPVATKPLPDCKVKRNYTCQHCDFFTQNPREFLYHLRDVHRERVNIYECPNCLYASKHFQKLLRHTKMVHGVETSKKRTKHHDADEDEDETIDEHCNDDDDDDDDDDDEEDDEFCEEDSSSTTSTSRPSLLKCSVCDFTSRNRAQLSRHEREEHIKTKFFRCSKCTYVTHIKARYTKHVKYHSMPMIKCDLCDFRTPYKWNLDRHCKNHNGRGAFKCSACNFTADIKQSLTVHEMNHHVPPVGQAAGLGVGRRRNKVGASDTTAAEEAAAAAAAAAVGSTGNVLEESTQTKPHHGRLSDFIHPDDIIQRANGKIYIKNKCKRCNFKSAWTGEMTRHERKVHGQDPTFKKTTKPLPNLIPITAFPPLKVAEIPEPSEPTMSQKDMNDICARSANSALKDFASLFGSEDVFTKATTPPPTQETFKRKNASFFDRLKEKLELGNTLICKRCGHESKCLTELAKHQKTCGKETDKTTQYQLPTRSIPSSSRCQFCRQRCKSSLDLYNHLEKCESKPHPMENKVFVWNDITVPMDIEVDDSCYEYTMEENNGLDLSVRAPPPEKIPTHGNDISVAQHKRVFKCPHCSFWASTASRFHVHIVGHLNKKPFECSLCSYRSNWRWDITKHIKLKSVRDQAHESAKVLMTDETGRRNYTKYNKYLTEIAVSGPQAASETSGGSGTRHKTGGKTVRPPPPLKAADGDFLRMLNEKKRSEGKRTLFKCKKCNFRDASRDILLQHVKGHYQQHQGTIGGAVSDLASTSISVGALEAATATLEATTTTTSPPPPSFSSQDLSLRGTSPDRDERHCRLKHSGDVRVVTTKNGREKIEVEEQTDENDMDDNHPEGHLVDASTFPPTRDNDWKKFRCAICPYVTNSKSQYSYHKQFHKPRGGQYTCPHCSYNVSKRHLLHQHLKVHDDHQEHEVDEQEGEEEEKNNEEDEKNEIPLVWVSKNGKFLKMFKCRHCPHVNLRKVNIQEHEKMHNVREKFSNDTEHKCTECSYVCNNAGVLSSHSKVHQNQYGTVHCLVDATKTDEEQLQAFETLLFLCRECPARFLKENEFEIHKTFHNADLTYKCELCSYSSETKPYLLSHSNVHTEEYQERTTVLQGMHATSISNAPMENLVGLLNKPPRSVVPLSGTELYQQKEARKASDPQVEAFMHGNPDFVYPTYLKNGRMKEKRYKCHKCPSAFEKREQYKVHLGLHGSQQRYSCEHCDYSVKYYANFVQHVKKHKYSDDAHAQKGVVVDDEKKLAWCCYCPYTSMRKDAVENHKKRHACVSGVTRTYSCEHCDYSVPQAHFLKEHVKLHFMPNKANRPPDGYMICDSLKLTSTTVKDGDGVADEEEEEEEVEEVVFDENASKEEEEEGFNNNKGEKQLIDVQTGELVNGDAN